MCVLFEKTQQSVYNIDIKRGPSIFFWEAMHFYCVMVIFVVILVEKHKFVHKRYTIGKKSF